MINFYLIRHGETEENAHGVCQGQTPGTLTAEGLAQAARAGEALQTVKFDTIYSSDLLRAMRSTEAIAQFQQNKAITPCPLLRERYLAEWQGKPFPKGWDWDDNNLPEGAETSFDLIARAEEFLDLLTTNNQNQTVLALSHGGLIRAFWTVLLGKSPESYYQWSTTRNTGISRFQIMDDGTVECLFLDSVEHLEDKIKGDE
ncbi:MAG: histidine phosphatase family protein [Mangrovibacterium sp.]